MPAPNLPQYPPPALRLLTFFISASARLEDPGKQDATVARDTDWTRRDQGQGAVCPLS